MMWGQCLTNMVAHIRGRGFGSHAAIVPDRFHIVQHHTLAIARTVLDSI